MKILTLLITIASLSTALSEVKDITPQEVSEIIQKEDRPTVIDVRTKKEFDDGHLQGAINIDIKKEDFKEQVSKLDRNLTYVLHCKSGGRSAQALVILEELGFGSILHMKEGMNGYSKLK